MKEQKEKFIDKQEHNKYSGKLFSILGDSISTLQGYNPEGYNVFYTGDTCKRTGVCRMSDTWWGKVLEELGGKLLVNNSWSGSRVSKLPDMKEFFPSGCSTERTGGLHFKAILPDVVIIYLGTNDWGFGSKVGCNDDNKFFSARLFRKKDYELFSTAYAEMLKKIKTNYPHAEIWCCTLSKTYMSTHPDFAFPHSYSGIHMEEYNDVIRKLVRRYGCRLIDLYAYHSPYDSVDGTHPTCEGMKALASLVLKTMYEDADNMGISYTE